MIKSIHLGNFKAFADTQNIPIKPITLIFGPNSAGKSSIIHSLALADQASKDNDLDIYRTELGGSSIDLGGFRQYIYRRQANRRLEFGMTFDTAYFEDRLAENFAPVSDVKVTTLMGMPLDDQDRPMIGSEPKVLSYEIEADHKTVIRLSHRPDGSLVIDQLDQEHPVMKRILRAAIELMTTTDKITDKDLAELSESVDEVLPALRFLPNGVTIAGPEISGEKEFQSHKFNELVASRGMIPVGRGTRRGDIAQVVKLYLPRLLGEIIVGLNQSALSFLNNLEYLGPLRSYPPRHLAFSEHEDGNWRAGGAYAWDIVRNNPEVREKVNVWLTDEMRLKTPYELIVRRLVPPTSAYDAIYDGLFESVGEKEITAESPDAEEEKFKEITFLQSERTWDDEAAAECIIKHLLDESKVEGISELVLVDKRSNTIVSHKDVGIGISQVLPVLVGAYGSQKKVVAIEQPEIHLHPKLQAELGDVFIESALGENHNTFLLETHSEHLILRIMRRIRESKMDKLSENLPKITNEDVCVLYVDPEGPASVVREMPLNEMGELVKAWPGGFFEEALDETL